MLDFSLCFMVACLDLRKFLLGFALGFIKVVVWNKFMDCIGGLSGV